MPLTLDEILDLIASQTLTNDEMIAIYNETTIEDPTESGPAAEIRDAIRDNSDLDL
jgi:hypothetical protein